MTQTDALGYAIGLCEEVARGGVDEADEAARVLDQLQTTIITRNVRAQVRREVRQRREREVGDAAMLSV